MNSTDTYVNPQTCLTRYFADFTLFLKLHTPTILVLTMGTNFHLQFSQKISGQNLWKLVWELS